MKIDHVAIKALAREMGCRADDLLAQAQQSDPFYIVPYREEAGRWFAALLEQIESKSGLYLRRIHYRLVSLEEPVLKPDGTPYRNTMDDWKLLLRGSLAARYIGLVPPDALIDRRNPDPILNAVNIPYRPPEAEVLGRRADFGWRLDEELDAPRYSLEGFTARQPYIVELWIEKTSQNDVLVPLARRLGINLVPGTGETSEILARQVVGRAIEAERPMRILYVSDFDPGGRSMPVALARKIEFMVRDAALDLDITLQPIALLPEQCAHYRLPRIPLKETERRSVRFEARFGDGATELDALEALHPGELARVVEAEVCRYIDPTLTSRVREAEREHEEHLDYVAEHVRRRHDVASLQARYDEIRADLEDLEDDAVAVWAAVADDLETEAPQFSPEAVPEPRPADPVESPLFDSKRDYLDQIDAYRRWQGRGEEAGQ